jgi:hypothetical protein
MAALLADAGKLGDLDLRNRQRHECPTGSNWETIGKFGLRKTPGPKRRQNGWRNRRIRACVSLGTQSKVTGVS